MISCIKCKSENVISGVQLKIENQNLISSTEVKLIMDMNQEGIFFKEEINVLISARVCRMCGFVELYATQPEELGRALEFLIKEVEQKEKKLENINSNETVSEIAKDEFP